MNKLEKIMLITILASSFIFIGCGNNAKRRSAAGLYGAGAQSKYAKYRDMRSLDRYRRRNQPGSYMMPGAMEAKMMQDIFKMQVKAQQEQQKAMLAVGVGGAVATGVAGIITGVAAAAKNKKAAQAAQAQAAAGAGHDLAMAQLMADRDVTLAYIQAGGGGRVGAPAEKK
ncbi:MAG: hypothetical protein ABIA04_01795, partial [Pseudomonadota bacterium]